MLLTEFIYRAIDSGDHCIAVFVDDSNAVYTVDTEILLHVIRSNFRRTSRNGTWSPIFYDIIK